MAIIGVTDYTNIYAAGTYRNSVKKQEVRNSQTETTSFCDKVEEVQGAVEKTNSSTWAGDMVVPQPPNYSGFTYDSSISNKSKEEMTMDEYKQWFMNEMSKMPVSSWVRSTFSCGALVIKEEAFERMKSDPEYEQYVLNRIRTMYSVSSLPVGSNNVGYEVIGASLEECYGYAGPIGNNGSNIFGNGKSWWEKRHEKMEELMEEQAENALKKAQAQRAFEQECYLNNRLANQQRLQSFLSYSTQGSADMMHIPSTGMTALAAMAYESNISIFSKSVMESQK